MLKKMFKSKEFVSLVVANENITCHLLKVLMMKCGCNKILMTIVKLIVVQMDANNKQNILYTTVVNYINKYG